MKPVKAVRDGKMSIKHISDDELQDIFTEAFASQVGSYNGIDEFDAKCTKDINKNSVQVDVTVQGFAGCPTAEDFKKGKVKNASSITISREGKGELKFDLYPKETTYINSTEYVLVYKTV